MSPRSAAGFLLRIGNIGVTPQMDFQLASKVVITNLTACGHVVMTLPYFWIMKSLGAAWLANLVLPLTLFFALIPLVNRAGFTSVSRHLLLGAINCNVYLYAASMGLDSSIQSVFYFTLISPLMLFALGEWRSIVFCVSQPVVLWALLLWKGSWIVPQVHIAPWAYLVMRPAISLTTAVMVFSCSLLVVWLQQQSEKRLEAARSLAASKQKLEVVLNVD
jgi:hypothetical protein